MMPHKLRKVRKMRGSRTHGYGVVGQHRKTGTKGHRKAHRDKGGWTYTVKYEPDYFGKKGFIPRGMKARINVINVGELDDLIDKLSKEKKSKKKGEKVILDLEELGYGKLLGTGEVTQPAIVKVSSYSKTAFKKVQDAGGEILNGTV